MWMVKRFDETIFNYIYPTKTSGLYRDSNPSTVFRLETLFQMIYVITIVEFTILYTSRQMKHKLILNQRRSALNLIENAMSM